MIRLIVFDLDGTLAELGKGILPGDLEMLREIEARGARIAVCSGKPAYYLCGFLRQAGLASPILVGENGGVIQFGVDLPPREYHVLPHSDDAKRTIRFLREEFDRLLPGLWYQPNEVGLTPFPRDAGEFAAIEDCLRKNRDRIRDVTVYRHCDSFDITPNGIDKYRGLEFLGELLGITPEETVAVGDGVNDYPMFAYAGHAVGVRVRDPEKVHRNFETAAEALGYLLTLLPSREELPL